MQHSNDIEFMVKQANIFGRLARGVTGAVKSAPKGALLGGLAAGALTLPTMGLAPALGVGGAGIMSGAMFGGAARGAIGGVRGLLSKSPKALSKIPAAANTAELYNVVRGSNRLLNPTTTTLGGAGLGYMLSDDDNKLLGTALGAAGGMFARPAVMKMLEKRVGRPV